METLFEGESKYGRGIDNKSNNNEDQIFNDNNNDNYNKPTTPTPLHPHNHLAQFHIRDITRPLTLTEQENLAHRLVQQIVQVETKKQTQVVLPKHLEDVRKMVDPAGKVQGKLPIFSQLSPRTKRKLAVLPRPNEFEAQQMRQLERQTKEIGGKRVYESIHDPRQFVELEKTILSEEIAEPKPHLIPNNIIDPRQIDKHSTKIYEDSEKYKKRKEEQALQLQRLFGESSHRYNHLDDQQSLQSDLMQSSISTSGSNPASMKKMSVISSNSPNSKSTNQTKLLSFSEVAATMSRLATSPLKPSNEHKPTHPSNNKKANKKMLPPLLSSSQTEEHLLDAAVIMSENNSGKRPMSTNDMQKGKDSTKDKQQELRMAIASSPLKNQSLMSISTSSSTVSYQPLLPQYPGIATKQTKREQQEYLNEFSARVKDEMGIDLNAKYNKLRKFRQCLQLLLLHMLHCRQRAALQRWWAVTLALRKRTMKKAASKIYKALKHGISWRRKREQEHYERLQREDEFRRKQANEQFIFKQAVRVTCAVRRYVKRKRLWHLIMLRKAATVIQRHVRGRLGRKRHRRIFLARQRTHMAAVRIQCMVRLRLAYRRRVLLRKLSFVDAWITSLNEKTDRYRSIFKQNGAVSYIARAYRNYTIMRKLHRMVYWNHVAKAIVIQRAYRGYRTRKIFHIRLKIHRQLQEQQYLAAVIIQSMVRRFLAERLLDALYAEKEEERQTKYQDKLWKLAQGISWQTKLVVLLRKWSLKTRIYKMLYLHQQATHIQRVWRGHHGRIRMWYVRVHTKLAFWRGVFIRRHKAAVMIQKHIRGYLTRKALRHRKLLENVVRVQCAFRMYVAKVHTREKKTLHRNAKTLTSIMRRLITKHRFHVKFMRQKLLAEKIVVIQCLMRKQLAIRRTTALRAQRRREVEQLASARSHMLHLLAGIQCRLLYDTITKPIQQRYYVVCKKDCLCLGPLQAIFVLGFCKGNRLRTEPKFLLTHKVDSASFVKFLMKIEGLVQMTKLQMQAMGFIPPANSNGTKYASRPANGVYHIHPDSDAQHHLFRQQSFASQNALKQPLLTLLMTGDIPLPDMKTALSTNDIDIVFAKAKSEENVTHKLGYMEFISALDSLAQQHYRVREKRNKKLNASKLDASANNEQTQEDNNEGDDDHADETDINRENNNVEDDAITNDNDTEDEVPEESLNQIETDENVVGQNLQQLLAEQTHQIHHGKHAFLKRDNLTLDPRSILTDGSNENNKSIDYRFALIIRILYVFQQESYVQEALAWLALEADARLSLFVVRMQCLVRKRLARLKIKRVKLEKLERQRQEVLDAQLARIQAMARSFVYRRRVMQIAQRVIVKYQPYLGEAYYYNPRTQVKTYEKPKVLGHLDAFTIALPEENLAYVVYCYNCSTEKANCFCQECEDSMCRLCFDSLHCKGQRRSHHAESIPTCAYCHGQQMATKSCVTCVISRPAINSYRATIQPIHRRAYYCDTCFVHEHDAHFYKQLETIPTKRQAYQTLLQHSRQATLIANTLSQRIRTKHTFTNLVQVCEECQQFSSAWRCFDCEQVYCGRCLVVFHQLNPKFITHAIEQLPYYTPDMHTSYHEDVKRKRFTYKWERMLLQERRRTQEIIYHAAVKLQAWYRMHFYRRIGKRIMQRRRSKQRSMFRLRKKENAQFREHRWYQIEDFFGRAPMLISDTKEEKVLKRMPLWSRETARRYILQNFDEWAYYRLRDRHNRFGEFTGYNETGKGKDKKKKKTKDQVAPLPLMHIHGKRKGIPKRGFDVGEIEELISQAKYGGFRLPGRVTVRENDQYADTTYNLIPYLRRGEIVRIHTRYFGVIAVEETRVKLSRKWYINVKKIDEENENENNEEEAEIDALAEKLQRAKERSEQRKKKKEESENEENDMDKQKEKEEERRKAKKVKEEDGAGSIISMDKKHSREWSEVMYRVPTYRDEKGQLYYKWKYLSYEYTVNNPAYQAYLHLTRMLSQRMIRLSLHFYHTNQQMRNPQEAQEWKQAAVKYAQKLKDATAQLATGDAFVDLSSLASPYLHGQEEDPVNNPVLKPIYLEDQEERMFKQAPERRRNSTTLRKSNRKSHENGSDESDEDSDENSDSEEDSEDEGRSDDSSDDRLLSPKLRKKPESGDMSQQVGNKIIVGGDEMVPSSRRARIRNMAASSSDAKGKDSDEEEDDEEKEERERMKKLKRDGAENDNSDDDEIGFENHDDEEEMPDARVDYDSTYIDPETGQKTLSAAEIKRREREERAKAKKESRKNKSRKSKKSSKKITKPKKAWFATKEQEEERKAREDKMTLVELAMEAGEWKEEIDVLTENIYFININTNEMMTLVPRAVQAKRQLEFENGRKKRDFDIARKRIQRLEMETKNRLLITGGRKK